MRRDMHFGGRLFLVLILALFAGLSCSTESDDDGEKESGSSGCPTGWYLCNGVCTDLTTNPVHCGACNQMCQPGQGCVNGTCGICPAGRSICAGLCVDTLTDPAHCGGCNSPCPGTCSGGVCSAGGSGGSGGGAGGSGGGAGGSGGGAGTPWNAGTGASPWAGAGGVSGGGGAGVSGVGGAGISGSGGAGISGSGGAGASSGDGGSSGALGGYIVNGAWHGFGWTWVTAGTITPEDFSDVTDFPLCASGSVDTGQDNVGMIGWNVNEVEGEPMATVTPAGEGINVSVTNPGGSQLRVQIQGPQGETVATDRWCAVIPGTGGFVPYDAFNTECWAGGDGTTYAGQPIVAVIVIVPGSETGPVAFDFCVNNIEDANEGGGPVGQGCSLTGGPGEGGGTISGNDTRTVTRDGRQYVVQNNVWNGDSNNQTLSVNGVSFEVTQQGNSSPTTGAPSSFPSVFIGSNFGHSTSGSNLPKQVSALGSVQTGWRWSAAGGMYGAAYDVWFSTGPGGDGGSPSGGYLMVWFDHDASVVPLGTPQGTESVAGRSWQVWVCSNQSNGCNQGGVPVISYIPASGALSDWSFDLNDFIQNAVSRYGVIQSGWYLTNVFAGFEIWSGGTGLRTDDFCAVVN